MVINKKIRYTLPKLKLKESSLMDRRYAESILIKPVTKTENATPLIPKK